MQRHAAIAFVASLLLAPGLLAESTQRLVPAQFATIQQAINASANGDEIVIAPGVYAAPIRFNGRSVVLRSTDPADPASVSGTILTDGGSGRPIVEISRGESVRLQGLTFADAVVGVNGAVWIDATANPGANVEIEGCRFVDNEGVEAGAINAYGDAVLDIHDSLFTGNDGREELGGVIYLEGRVDLLVEDSLFDRNPASSRFNAHNPGVIRVFRDPNPSVIANPVVVRGTTFSNNGATAVYSFGRVDVLDSRFLNVASKFGQLHGRPVNASRSEFVDFRGDSLASVVAGIDTRGGVISDCVFLRGDDAILGDAATVVTNSTFHASGRAADDVGVFRNSIVTGSFSTVSPFRLIDSLENVYYDRDCESVFCAVSRSGSSWIPGLDPYVETPSSVLGDLGNLRLRAGSVAIDAGDATQGTSSLDLDGNPRRVDDPNTVDVGIGFPAVDLGAYEFQPFAACPVDFNADGVVDNGDIVSFVALFLDGDLAADANADGLLDNGDITTFVSLFLAGC